LTVIFSFNTTFVSVRLYDVQGLSRLISVLIPGLEIKTKEEEVVEAKKKRPIYEKKKKKPQQKQDGESF
jgi:hypothetical protein